jgi:hypothetical protein
VEILEPKLGDVVSGDLWSLVNETCEPAVPSAPYFGYRLPMARRLRGSLFAWQHAVQFPTGFLYSLNDAERLSTRPITWRLTAMLGIFFIALMIATPSFEEAYRENGVLFIDPLPLSPIRSVTPHCNASAS